MRSFSDSSSRHFGPIGAVLLVFTALSAFATDSGAVIESSASPAKLNWPVSSPEQGELIFNLNPDQTIDHLWCE